MRKCCANFSDKQFLNKYCIFSALIGAGASVLGAGISAAVASSNNSKNISAQKDINAQNIAAQKEINAQNIAAQKEINQSQLDYAKSMTQAQWERDDNAHQREVADLAAAGLSPLANTTGSPVTSAQSYNPQSEGVAVAPKADFYASQAPQIDTNSIVNSFLGLAELQEKSREHDDKMIREDNALSLQSEKLVLSLQQLNLEDKKLQANIEQFTKSYVLQVDQLEQTKAELQFSKDKHDNEQYLEVLSKNSQMVNKALEEDLNKGFHSKVYTDLHEYEKALESWGKAFNSFIVTKLSKKSSKGAHFGVNAGKEGVGAGVNFGGNSSINNNYEKSLLLEFTSKFPHPVYVHTISY